MVYKLLSDLFLYVYLYVVFSQLYEKVHEKMEEMQQHNMSWIEVQFLNRAVAVLCQCRQTLMYTYVFAFYLKKNNQSIIFEVLPLVSVNSSYYMFVCSDTRWNILQQIGKNEI